VNAADNPETQKSDTAQFKNYPLAIKDTVWYSKGFIVLDTVLVNPDNGKAHFKPTDTALMARVTVVSRDSMRYTASPYFYLSNNSPVYVNDTVFAQDLALRFNRVGDNRKIELGVKESAYMVPFVALKVLEFPQINILWFGTIIMIIGFIMSIIWRRKQVAARESA
jgi:cytochrome c-type biogenesis protein CcmF